MLQIYIWFVWLLLILNYTGSVSNEGDKNMDYKINVSKLQKAGDKYGRFYFRIEKIEDLTTAKQIVYDLRFVYPAYKYQINISKHTEFWQDVTWELE